MRERTSPMSCANSSSTANAPTIAELLAMRDTMLIGHPETVAKIPRLFAGETTDEPLRFRCSFDGMPIFPCHYVPRTRKTGRVIWEPDPWVTYEETDREWGLKLGFCKEEEEEVFYAMHGPSRIVVNTF